MGGGGGGTTTTVQKSDPWSGVQPYLTSAYAQAAKLYGDSSNFPQYYPGSTVAPLNGAQNSALGQIEQYGTSQNPLLQAQQSQLTGLLGNNPALSNPALSGLESTANGDQLNANNPYLSQMESNIKAQVLPGLQSQFEGSGNLNSSLMAQAAGQGLGNAIGGLNYQNYQQGLQNQLTAQQSLGSLYGQGTSQQLAAAGLAPSAYQAPLTGMNAALTAGGVQQQQAQNELTGQVNAFNYNQNQPYNMLNQYLGLLQGQGGGTVSTSQPYYQNQAAGALGGALSGAMLGSQLMPGIGTGIGAAAGGLLGLIG